MQQSTYLNQVLALNNQRSENEIAIVHQIGYRLESSFEDKPIVFVGKYDLGSWIEQQIAIDNDTTFEKFYTVLRFGTAVSSYPKTDILEKNVNSLLEWSSRAFENQNLMKAYFSYCGYDITTMDFKDGKSADGTSLEEYTAIAKQENMKPFEIRDMGDYILVCLGDLGNVEASDD